MIFSLTQLQELLDIIDQFHCVYIAKNIGSNFLSTKDKKALLNFGIDINLFSKTGIIDDVFRFGILVQSLGDQRAKTLNFVEFKKFLKSGKFLPLSRAEELALENVKLQTYNDIKGLGNRVSQQFNTILIETSKKQRLVFQNTIKETVSEAITNRESANYISSQLGHKTKDWSRDLDRIANYVLHDAFQHGIASSIIEKQGTSAKVYFDVRKTACKHCKRIYLKPNSSEPKLFLISELIDNGSNIGRKAADYKASLSPLHPWCNCQLRNYIEGFQWDKKQGMFILTRVTHGVTRQSKVKIKVNGKEI